MPRVGIIGTGFGGVAIAAELLRNGYRDVVLWERSDAIGGVWRDNTYPGAACDVPSPFYSFSFAPWDAWPRRYAPQPAILDYLRTVAEREGVTARTRFAASVVAATWSGTAWSVTFADGSVDTVDVLVSAVGQLSTPSVPDVAGAGEFAGAQFHTARWPSGFAPRGRRIAVVGSAATAVQLVPALARAGAEVTLLQRSANYIWPKPDGAYPRWYRRLARHERGFFRWLGEQFSRQLEPDSVFARIGAAVTRAHLRLRVRDRTLRAQLAPDYPIGCKRILFSNDFYPALQLPSVALETTALARIVSSGIELVDGRVIEADTLVWATGFAAQSFLDGISVTAGGRHLHAEWDAAGGARAMLGLYVPGFPNFAIAYGPNTNLGGSSILLMLEAQARHLRLVLDETVRRGETVFEASVAGEAAWDADVQSALGDSAWASCRNWYRDPVSGRITSNWPGGPNAYVRRVAELDAATFAFSR